MKCNLLRSCAVALVAIAAVGISGQANADIVLFTNPAGNTGNLLDNAPNIATDLPLTVAVPEIMGLSLTVESATSSATGNNTLNASGGAFGVNSAGTDDAARFDSDLDESVTFSFSQDVTIETVGFNSFGAGSTFSFGGVTITQPELGAGGVFTFANGGLVVPAGTGILLEAGLSPTGVVGGGEDVGLVSLDIVVSTAAIPEPSSLALLGLGSLVIARRRRRA